jgi:dynactin complex subunit
MSDALDLARRTLEGHKGHAQNKDGWDFNECCTLAGEVVAQAARIAELEAGLAEAYIERDEALKRAVCAEYERNKEVSALTADNTRLRAQVDNYARDCRRISHNLMNVSNECDRLRAALEEIANPNPAAMVGWASVRARAALKEEEA